MPYCPKCKTEYIEGIIECSDCHVPLIDSEKDLIIPSVFLISAETELARRIKEFLGYSGIDVSMKFDPHEDLFDIYVASNQFEDADCLLKLLLANKVMEINKEQEQQKNYPIEHPYMNAKERYEDMRSSAFSFLIVGIFILFVIVLSLTVFSTPILGTNNPFSTSILAILAIFCIIYGLLSRKKATELKDGVQIEACQTNAIMHWFTSTYTPTQIDALVKANVQNDAILNEILTLKRLELIRIFIKREYNNIHDDYLDDLAEDIYEELYES